MEIKNMMLVWIRALAHFSQRSRVSTLVKFKEFWVRSSQWEREVCWFITSRQLPRYINKCPISSPSPFLWALSALWLVLLRPVVRKETAFDTWGANPGQAMAEKLQWQPGRFSYSGFPLWHTDQLLNTQKPGIQCSSFPVPFSVPLGQRVFVLTHLHFGQKGSNCTRLPKVSCFICRSFPACTLQWIINISGLFSIRLRACSTQLILAWKIHSKLQLAGGAVIAGWVRPRVPLRFLSLHLSPFWGAGLPQSTRTCAGLFVFLCRASAEGLSNKDQSHQSSVSVDCVLRDVVAPEVFNIRFSIVTASHSCYCSLEKINTGPFVWASINAQKGEWELERYWCPAWRLDNWSQ